MRLGQQLPLFERTQAIWADRTWRNLDPEKQREILELLTEIGRCAIAPSREPTRACEGGRHES